MKSYEHRPHRSIAPDKQARVDAIVGTAYVWFVAGLLTAVALGVL